VKLYQRICKKKVQVSGMGVIRKDGQAGEVGGCKETDNRKHIKKVEGKGTNKEKEIKL